MNLQQLRALVAVAGTGSINAAARVVGVTQPVLSRTLRELEKSVGVTLLRRSARGAVLTEYGEALAARARLVDTELRKAREDLDQLRGVASGRISVACSPVPTMFVLPAAMALFRTQFPGIEVRVSEVVYPQVMQAFRDGAIDFAVGPMPPAGLGPDFTVTRLFDVELVVVVKRGHPRASARSIAALGGEEWVVTGPAQGPGAVVADLFRRNDLAPPAQSIYLETVSSAVEMIRHTDLAGLLPAPVAAAAGDSLVVVPVRERCEPLRMGIAVPARAILTPAARALVSAIRATSSGWSSAATAAERPRRARRATR